MQKKIVKTLYGKKSLKNPSNIMKLKYSVLFLISFFLDLLFKIIFVSYEILGNFKLMY